MLDVRAEVHLELRWESRAHRQNRFFCRQPNLGVVHINPGPLEPLVSLGTLPL